MVRKCSTLSLSLVMRACFIFIKCYFFVIVSSVVLLFPIHVCNFHTYLDEDMIGRVCQGRTYANKLFLGRRYNDYKENYSAWWQNFWEEDKKVFGLQWTLCFRAVELNLLTPGRRTNVDNIVFCWFLFLIALAQK